MSNTSSSHYLIRGDTPKPSKLQSISVKLHLKVRTMVNRLQHFQSIEKDIMQLIISSIEILAKH